MPTQNDAVRELAERLTGDPLMDATDVRDVERIIRDALRPLLAECESIVVNGRTDTGCDSLHMRLRAEFARWKEPGR